MVAAGGCWVTVQTIPRPPLITGTVPLSRISFLAGSLNTQKINFTLTAPITTAADDILEKCFHCFSEKIRLDISCESSARLRIHIKHEALFFSKDTIFLRL